MIDILFYERQLKANSEFSQFEHNLIVWKQTNDEKEIIDYDFAFIDDKIAYDGLLKNVFEKRQNSFQTAVNLKNLKTGDIDLFKDCGQVIELNTSKYSSKVIGTLINISLINKILDDYNKIKQEYDFLSSNIQDVVWIIDIKTFSFIYVSPSIQKLRGVTQEEALRETLSDALTFESYQKVIKIFREKLELVLSGKEEENYYVGFFEQPTKDGKIKIVEIKAKFIYDDHKRPIRIVGVSRDATEAVSKERDMKSNLDKFNKIFDLINNGLILTDSNGRILDYNQNAKNLFGFEDASKAEIYFDEIFEKFDFKLLSGNIKNIINFEELLKFGYGYNFECEIKQNEKNKYFEINIKPLNLGKYGFLITINDITQRVNFEKYLKRNLILEKLVAFLATEFLTAIDVLKAFQKTAETLKLNLEIDRIYIAEIKSSIESASPYFQIIFDITDYEKILPVVINTKVETLDFENFAKKLKEISDVFIDLNSFPEEIKVNLIAEGYKAVFLFPIYLRERLYGFLGLENYGAEKVFEYEQINILRIISKMLSDFLERKNFEKSLEKAKQLAEEANRTKSIFLAKISHEIRTPLNGIIGMSELSLNSAIDNSLREYLNSIRSSANSLLELLNDILDMSKIEAGKLELVMEDFNLNELLEKTIEMLAAYANEKGIELLLKVDYSIPDKLIGDQLRIKQILANLLSNAIKFTDEGEVILSVEKIKENYSEKEVEILFSVKDTGIGIEKDKLNIIFDSFSQADSTKSRKYGGAGLGLAISKNLAEMMGGNLKVESEVGKGSIFYFQVSFRYRDSSTLSFQVRNLNIKRALIIDDNENAQIILKDMLFKFGIESESVGNGIEGIQKISILLKSDNKFDAVFLDYMMPYMDGLITAENIRNYLKLNNLPIIMMFSSDKVENLKEKCLELNIINYLNKPCRYSEIRRVLMDISGEKSEEEQKEQIKFEKIGLRFEDKTILIAEDNSINMMIAAKMLSNVGAQILQAKDGLEAYEIAMKRKIDLIFMDVNMPNMDGFQATKKIREMEKDGNHIPIIAVTANAMRGDKEECLAAGMDDYISKPFKMEEIYKILLKYFKNVEDVDLNETEDLFLKETLQLALFDKTSFMSRLVNDKDFALQVIDEIEKTLPKRIDELNTAFLEQNYEKLAWSSHSIKGVAAYLSSERIRILSEKIEKMSKNHDEISEMVNYFEFLKSNIKDLLGEVAKLKFKLKNS